MKIKNTLAAMIAACCLLTVGCSSKDADESSSNSSSAVADENSSAGDSSSVVVSSEIGKSGDGNLNFELKVGDTIAEFNIEGYGTIKAKLFPEIAPKGVDNFIKLAEQGYYNGKTIHRVMSDFMLQGGSLNGDGTGGEAADGGDFGVEANYNARHFYGALCYANAAGRNTTQFYIVNNKKPQDFTQLPPANIRATAESYTPYRDAYDESSFEYQYYDNMVTYYNNLADMIENALDGTEDKYKAEGGTPTLDGGYTVFGQVYEGLDVIDAISACEVEARGNELSKPVDTITITSVTISEYAG